MSDSCTPKIVRFVGWYGLKTGHGITTHPYMGPTHSQPDGSVKRYWVPGDEVLFDRTLAAQHGRTCGAECGGGCFAEMHTAVWNTGQPGKSSRFTVREVKPMDEPVSESTSDDQDGVILPMRKRRRQTA